MHKSCAFFIPNNVLAQALVTRGGAPAWNNRQAACAPPEVQVQRTRTQGASRGCINRGPGGARQHGNVTLANMYLLQNEMGGPIRFDARKIESFQTL